MKKLLFAVLLLLAAITVLTGILWIDRSARAVNVKTNMKDAREHGLTIITAADPAFNDLMAVYAQRHPTAPIEDLKPSSVFVKNETERTVVAYRLKWECIRADGTTVDKVMAISTIWALTNGAGDNTEAQLASTTHVIRPNTALFFSLAWPSEALDDANPVAMQEDSEQLEALKDQNVELKSYAEITVSIDGAFFDDGAFVGTDTTGYFAEIKAQVDAAYDVLREFQLGKQSGKAADEISRRLDEAANGPNIRLGSSSTPEDHYLHDKKRIAQELSNIWKYKGDDKALKYVSMRLGKPWPTLRKL